MPQLGDFIQMDKKSVLIGIPAYNEEKNILNLLDCLIRQKRNNYDLHAIVVACDGSTDSTPALVNEYSQKHKEVILKDDRQRKGKSERLNDFYRDLKADVFFAIDADVTFKDDDIIDNMVTCFQDPKIGLTAANDAPLPGKNFVGKCCEAYEDFWTETVNRVKDGNNVHAHPGHVSAGSREFLSRVRIPSDIVADDHFLYFECIKKGFIFRSCRLSNGYIKVPETFADFMRQSTRFYDSAEQIKKYFGETAEEAYRIPFSAKLKAYVIIGSQRPIYLAGALILQLLQRFLGRKYTSGNTRLWTTITSSK